MNWLTEYVKPQLKKLWSKSDSTPDNAWIKCPDTGLIIHRRELAENLFVSPHSDYHFKMPIERRFKSIFDDGIFEKIESPSGLEDPIAFKDTKKYTERLQENRKKTGQKDAVSIAYGAIGKNNAVICAFNFDFMGGSMGSAVGEGIVCAADMAIEKRACFIIISASGGARMQEGVISLVQMARTTVAIKKVKMAKLPYIVLLTNPTTGGVTASIAMIGDIHIAEPRAMIGFAGRRVIEQTVREVLPEKFQTAEYLLDHGMVDMVVHRKHLKATLCRILTLLMQTGEKSYIVPIANKKEKKA